MHHVEKLYPPAEAERIAAALQHYEDGDGWTYRAIHAPNGTGLSFIAIYDEAGQFVGKY